MVDTEDITGGMAPNQTKEQASLVKNVDPEAADDHDDDDNDVLDKELDKHLKHNTFSLIYTAELTSSAFALAMFFALFQIALPVMALLDLIQFNNVKNPLKVPNDVSLAVRITGLMCLLLAIPLFWDLMDAIERLQQGPPPRSEQPVGGIPCGKFYFAYLLQFCVGVLYQIAIFILVVSSSSVLDLFLNFAALEFITEVDEIAFALALRGYLSDSIKKACINVTKHKLPHNTNGRCMRRIIYYLLSATLVGMFAWIGVLQRQGKFDCNRLQVQFGDGFITTLPLFSGFYNYERDYHSGRPIYWDQSKRSAFRYCVNGESGYWVFNYISGNITSIEGMCINWISRSPHTEGFSIMDIPSSTWLTKRRHSDKLEFPVDYFNLRCADCDDTNCNGQCVSGQCVCDKGAYGGNCEFREEPCELTDYDHRSDPFSGVGAFYSSEFELLRKGDGKPAFAYGRPIYAYFYPADSDFSEFVDILMNFGRRYFMLGLLKNLGNQTVEDDDDVDEIKRKVEIADYLETIHPFYDWIEAEYVYNETGNVPVLRPVFVSAALDIGTASDSISPLGLTWARVDATVSLGLGDYYNLLLPGAPIETTLLCAQCSVHHPCDYGGACNFENGTCTCDLGFEGPTCEVEPPCIAAGNCTFGDNLEDDL